MHFHRPMSKWTSPEILSALWVVISIIPLGVQGAPQSNQERSFGAVYDAAHETTLMGTIWRVVTKHVAGDRSGTRVLIAGPLGGIDADLTPYSQDIQVRLRAGTEVQMTGSMETLLGKQILLVRQLNFDGRVVTVRSPRGFLIRASANGTESSGSGKAVDAEGNGGAR